MWGWRLPNTLRAARPHADAVNAPRAVTGMVQGHALWDRENPGSLLICSPDSLPKSSKPQTASGKEEEAETAEETGRAVQLAQKAVSGPVIFNPPWAHQRSSQSTR